MVRFEWLELMVRLAVAKYGNGQFTDSVAEALTNLITTDILLKIPAEYCAVRCSASRVPWLR